MGEGRGGRGGERCGGGEGRRVLARRSLHARKHAESLPLCYPSIHHAESLPLCYPSIHHAEGLLLCYPSIHHAEGLLLCYPSIHHAEAFSYAIHLYVTQRAFSYAIHLYTSRRGPSLMLSIYTARLQSLGSKQQRSHAVKPRQPPPCRPRVGVAAPVRHFQYSERPL